MGGGGSGSTQQTQTTAPWTGQQPYLTGNSIPGWAPDANTFNGGGTATTDGGPGLLPAAQALYTDTSAWPKYFGGVSGVTSDIGNTYVPLTGNQQSFINAIQGYGAAGGNGTLNQANSTITSLMDPSATAATSGAFNSGQDYLSNQIGGSGNLASATGAYNQGNTLLGSIAGGGLLSNMGGTFNNSQDFLNNTLNSSSDPFQTPGFQNVVNGTLASVIPATSASFINGGRSDSGLAQAAQTSAATNAIGQLANQQYNTSMQQKQNAAGLASQNEGMGLNATQGAQSLSSQNLLSQLGLQQNAASMAASNYLNQQGNQIKAGAIAPTLDQQQLGDLQAGYNAAGQTQSDLQNQVNSAIDQWNYNQALPFNMLGMYQNYTGGNYGGASTINTPYHTNTGASALGGAASGAMLGSVAGPYGMAAGAVLGGLAGLF